MTTPRFFATPAAFGKWLHANHLKKTELWVGFWKTSTDKKSITWPESVDEALCVGWIDGIRKSLGEESYMIRFTPRTAASTWSAVNMRRMKVLTEEGRVLPAGHAAHERRKEDKSGVYSYENRHLAVFDADSEKQFRANKKAWAYFTKQGQSYQTMVKWWLMGAKKPETRVRRLALVIACSAAGEWLPGMKWTSKGK